MNGVAIEYKTVVGTKNMDCADRELVSFVTFLNSSKRLADKNDIYTRPTIQPRRYVRVRNFFSFRLITVGQRCVDETGPSRVGYE